jgi:hypothetical protein
MYLCTIYISTKFRPDRDFKYGHQTAILANQQSGTIIIGSFKDYEGFRIPELQ